MRVDKDEDGSCCPRMNMAPCAKHKCNDYIKMRGKNPNTGEELDGWQCATVWQVMLSIEANQRLNELGAAIESFRNETARGSLGVQAELEKVIEKAVQLSAPKTIPTIEG